MSQVFGRIFTAIVLLLVAGSAFAVDGSNGAIAQAHAFSHDLTPPMTDYSVAYLSQIFGTVGNVLQGTSGQILGNMFKILNEGLLVVAALWLGYTTIATTLHASQEGSFMGQNRNIMFVLLRVAFGFALIIPSSTTGYSLLQDIFMKVVVQGVGLADQVWGSALNYLQYGGSLYIPPSTLKTSTNITSSMLGSAPPSNLAVGTQIFQDEVCMVESQNWKSTQNQQSQPPASGPSSSIVPSSLSNYVSPYHPIFDESAGMVYFPGVNDSSTSNTGQSCGSATSYYVTHPQSGDNVKGGYSPSQLTAMQSYSYSALKQMVLSMLPAAQQYVTDLDAGKSETSLGKTSTQDVFSAILAYSNLITPYQNMLSPTYMQDSAQALQFVDPAIAEGWIMAGGFYWDVEQTNKAAQAVSINQLLPTTTPPDSTVYNAHKSTLDTAATTLVNSATDIGTLWLQYVGAQQNDLSTTTTTTSGSGGSSLLDKISSSSLSTLVLKDFSANPKSTNDLGGENYNPIVVLMSMGSYLLKWVVGVWIGAIAITLGLAILAGVCNAQSPTGLVFTSALSWVKSIMMLVTGALLVPGAILGYYVPLYPFIVFMFAAVGWFMMVIEGMVAAPMVCVGMTHPEGHDFLGKGEQALMLFLSIFLRPALMIIGLIASMVLSFVAFKMLIAGFGVVLSSLSGSGTFGGSALLVLINDAVVLVIFGMITMTLIEQCYGLIYKLPNNILAWIGGPQQGEDYSQMARGVQGAVSGAAGSLGKAARQGMDQALDTASSAGKFGGESSQKSKSGDINAPGSTPGGPGGAAGPGAAGAAG